MGVFIDLATGFEQHTAVATLETADEKHEVMATRKFLYAGQTVGDATTDGVVATKTRPAAGCGS